jgi:hypothetical protein
MTEFLIKNIVAEILFGSRICESVDDQWIVDYLYEELLLDRLLYGEPVTVPELRKILHQKILNFEFIKLNGEIRPAKGTTMMKYVPQAAHPKGIRPSSPKVATFYDLEKQDWRSVSQRSKEIVLKKDEETGKPVIMVKDKPEPGDRGVTDTGVIKEPEVKPQEKPEVTPEEIPTEQPDLTVDDKPVDIDTKAQVSAVSKVKPVESTENKTTFYFVNPETGASEVIEMTPKDAVSALKKMGSGWKLADKNEFEKSEEAISAASEKEPDILEVGDTRNYLNNKGENVEIQITDQDPYGGVFAKTPSGGTFKIPANKMQNIGAQIKKEEIKTKSTQKDIINKDNDLDNLEATEI